MLLSSFVNNQKSNRTKPPKNTLQKEPTLKTKEIYDGHGPPLERLLTICFTK